MSLRVFNRALKLCAEYDDLITLGGGEPTVHPDFEKFLKLAIKCNARQSKVFLVTNGKHTERALWLADLAKDGEIFCELSQDIYHEPIDKRVVEAFKPIRTCTSVYPSIHKYINIGYRNVTGKLIPVGRAVKYMGLEKTPPDTECVCEEVVAHPSGLLRQCGCPRSPVVGDVFKGYKIGPLFHECYRHERFKDLKKHEHQD